MDFCEILFHECERNTFLVFPKWGTSTGNPQAFTPYLYAAHSTHGWPGLVIAFAILATKPV